MTDGRDKPPFGFERDKPGTSARTEAETDIEALRQRGGMFVEAVARTRMPMAVTDVQLPGNPIVFANDSFVRLSGYSMKEILGQKPHFLNGPDTDPDDAARFREALRRGEDIVVDTWQYRKDGTPFYAAVFCSPIADAEGRVIQHFLSYLDITRRVETEETLRRHATELEQAVADRMTALREELRSTLILQELSTRLVTEENIQTIYEEILSAAIELTHARAGTVQMLDPENDELVVLATRGFSRTTQDYFHRIDASSNTSCGLALRTGDRSYFDFDPAGTETSVRLHVADGVLSAQSSPLVSRSGRPIGMVSTHWGEPRHRPSERELRFLDLLARQAADLLEQRESDAALRKSEERLRHIVESATDYAIFATDPQGVITDWMPGAEAVFGWSAAEAVGQPADMTFVPEDRAADEPEREMALAAREGLAPNVRWHIRKDGRRVFIDGTMTPLTDEAGRLRGYLKIGQDTTERRAAEQRQKLLLAELQHRVRNTLGVVRSIARRTAQNSANVEEMSSHLEGRLDAFARVQSMVTRRPGAGVDLAALIEDELVAHAAREGKGVTLDGPEVALAARPAETLSLAVHELVTNAVKYGALSAEDGRLAIRWTLADDRLELFWTETGVPGVAAEPEREGFGLELLRRVVPYELSAETMVEFRPDGLRFTLAMPAEGNIRAS